MMIIPTIKIIGTHTFHGYVNNIVHHYRTIVAIIVLDSQTARFFIYKYMSNLGPGHSCMNGPRIQYYKNEAINGNHVRGNVAVEAKGE